MGHDHNHGNLKGMRLLFTIILNALITVVEIAGGLLSGSSALLSDAFHNLSDTVSLIISGVALKFSKKDPDTKYTFGYRRAEILAALFNSLSMIVICILLVREGVERFFEPHVIKPGIMLIVAFVGLLGNLLSVLLLKRFKEGNLNIRSAYIHLLADTLSSVAVILCGLIIYYTGFFFIDALFTIIIALYILRESLSIFKKSFAIIMHKTPEGIEVSHVNDKIREIAEVRDVHHIHLWRLDDKRVMLEAHVVLGPDTSIRESDIILNKIRNSMKNNFKITHITIQFEQQPCKVY